MCSTLNAGFILRLFCVIAILTIAVDGNNTGSPGSTPQDSREIKEAIKSLETTLEKKFQKLIHVVNATSRGKPNAASGSPFASCKDIYLNHKSQGNRAYLLQMDSGKVPVFCHMTSHGLGACGGGGWTLVMKIDGYKTTFHYDSKLWSNKVDFNLPGGRTGFDHHETKLPSYWNTPFSKICLAMTIGKQFNFIVIYKQADSLYSMIADGHYIATSLGRNTWKTLIGSQASLQPNCKKEGFNVVCGAGASRARIGVIGNNENDCNSCDSRIGFGTGGYPEDSNTCGYVVYHRGAVHKKVMGYILVQ
ncbi:putative skeletal organic matrix protein 5 [Oculina patagonica]